MAERGFHMWTEVWMKDRWIPLDATLGKGGIGAAHLKLAHSSLADGEEHLVLLPIVNVVRQVEIEILDVNEN